MPATRHRGITSFPLLSPLLLLLLLLLAVDMAESKKPKPKPSPRYTPAPYGQFDWHETYDVQCVGIVNECRRLDETYKDCLRLSGCVTPSNPQCKAASATCESTLTHCIILHNPSGSCLDFISSSSSSSSRLTPPSPRPLNVPPRR